MSVGLYVMTEKGAAVLDAAIEAGVEIAHVTTAPAAGMNDDSHTAIAAKAKQAGIPTFLRSSPPDFAGTYTIAAGWRWMLDQPNLIVLHDSLLPRYRGFSPLVTALVNGEPKIGVTAFLAEEEPDTGPIIAQLAIPVSYPVRMREVLGRITRIYFDLASIVIQDIERGVLRYTVQDHSRATWSLWRDEDDYRIDWAWDDRKIARLVDAVSDPFPGAWTTAATGLGTTYRVPILEATVVPDRMIEDRAPGKIAYLDGGVPVVVCGAGLVKLPGLSFALKTRFV